MMSQVLEQPTGKVVFLEEPHIYLNEKNQRYLSVTQLLDKYKNKFNAREQAEKSSKGFNPKYSGRSVEDIMAEWEKAGSDARISGTSFHKKKEDNHIKSALSYSENKPAKFVPNPAMIIPEENLSVMTDYQELPDGSYSELILWSHRWLLAGIADKVIIDGDYFDIEDYKTNKEIKTTSYYSRGEGYKMLQFPLNHIMDCSFYHYELQLSLYAYMFGELSGKKARKLTLLHHPTINGKVTEEETRYDCSYRKTDVIMMLKMWGGFAPKDYKPEN